MDLGLLLIIIGLIVAILVNAGLGIVLIILGFAYMIWTRA